ncbi:uroporphyrinogen-III C-methyltransferase [Halioxenophilus aromaticivorans]|uniref:uroporphyrinogen-III C-methyltransferase n=1 Tax=Halioxenophilus aromaticivorans TaxID=1306992 RepID=A0AAV3U9W2_9ALTE
MSQSTVEALGRVAIVGAGPGDVDLLTLKAVKCIQAADVIFYDALVSEDIKALFPTGVLCIYVGKRKGRHAIPQEGINQALVDQAQLGLNVCRLKGGDPFIFGRGGEEALALRDAGVPVEVVPGVSAANGCSAYAGIPLTHRGITQGCTFVTAHSRNSETGAEADSSINWPALAASGNTLVFYMGLSRTERISGQLQRGGLAGDTPVAIVERGGTAQQRVMTGELASLTKLAQDNRAQAPALIIVGQVVRLHHELSQVLQSAQSLPQQMSA